MERIEKKTYVSLRDKNLKAKGLTPYNIKTWRSASQITETESVNNSCQLICPPPYNSKKNNHHPTDKELIGRLVKVNSPLQIAGKIKPRAASPVPDLILQSNLI